MRLILVRHGEPDYANDCLTELGQRQAEAAAERLSGEGIGKIYSSPMGRARQTAAYTAKRLGLPVEVLDFMHEISWGNDEAEEALVRTGHPWTLGDRMIAEEDWHFENDTWRQHPYFAENRCNEYLTMIAEQADALLAASGYRREGKRYFCTARNDRTAALFAHGGSGACLLSHLLNLPFPYVCSVLPYGYTSINILDFQGEAGQFVFPKIELINDMGHIRDLMSVPAPCGN